MANESDLEIVASTRTSLRYNGLRVPAVTAQFICIVMICAEAVEGITGAALSAIALGYWSPI